MRRPACADEQHQEDVLAVTSMHFKLDDIKSCHGGIMCQDCDFVLLSDIAPKTKAHRRSAL